MLVMTSQKINRQIIDASPGLRIVSNFGVGYENVDAEYAASKGVIVTNTPNVLTEATAEMGFTLLLAASRRVAEGDAFMRAGKFTGWKINTMLGRQLHGKTLAIFGCGRIGRTVARMASGFAMRVIYHDRNRLPLDVEQRLGATQVDFDDMLAEADFVIITASLNEQTRHRFTLETFGRMKRTAVLVNIGRGQIIREDDLVQALKQRLIFAAGLDVLEHPPQLAAELQTLDNVVLTPHLGSATDEARIGMSDLAIDAIIDVYHGRRPQYVVND